MLGTFSSGKSISTYVWVVLGDATLRATAYTICRDALVGRFVSLSNKIESIYQELGLESEIPEILVFVREEIRLSDDTDDEILSKFSRWCAILDYVEVQLQATCAREMALGHVGFPQWIVWCGHLEIPYGEIDAYMVTPDWSVSALQYWVNREAAQISLTHPRNVDYVFIPDNQIPYGTMFGLRTDDRLRLERQCTDLEVHTLRDTTRAQRYTLVPLSESYDMCPSLNFVDHSYICRTHVGNIMTTGPLLIDPRRQSLCCCWDKDACEDLFDDAISNFGENAIRIMNSFGNEFTIDMVKKMFDDYREFSNWNREEAIIETNVE